MVIDSYQIPTIIDVNKNFFENAAKARDAVRENQLPISASFDVQKLEKKLQIHELFFKTDEGLRTVQEFLDNGYFLEDNVIISKEFIPIEIVSYNRNQVKFVDSNEFKKHGFGIQGFRIYLDFRIYDVYCNGKHPNLNPNTNKFCMDNNITFLEITYDNIENFVKPMLGCVNMGFAYLNSGELEKVKELIGE